MTRELSAVERARLEQAGLTYGPVGASTAGLVGPGFHSVTTSSRVGTGRERFEQAVARLLGWRMHREAGISVRASSPVVADGVVAVLGFGVGRLRISAPVRVVAMIDEPDRQGFAYGTLPGHPVSGEEQFLLTHQADDSVVLEISAVSRAGTPLARLGGPVTRAVQARITDRYLDSV